MIGGFCTVERILVCSSQNGLGQKTLFPMSLRGHWGCYWRSLQNLLCTGSGSHNYNLQCHSAGGLRIGYGSTLKGEG